MLAITVEILFAALLLAGVLKREKLIAFERSLADRLARRVAQIICRRKAARIQKARALQARRMPSNSRAALRVVKGQRVVPSGRSIA